MDSQDIERAVNLCNYNFDLCEIYVKNNGNGNGNGNKPGKIKNGENISNATGSTEATA